MMASASVYGPYKARKRYRLVVVEQSARKSIIVPSIEAGESLRALLLGMRASEVLGRIVRDLDDGGTVLWIARGKTDNARRRLTVLEILQPLLNRLAAVKSAESLIFGTSAAHPNRPLTDAWLWGHVQKLCAAAGVPRMSTHSLRGLHSTLALEAGATSGAVAAALGRGSFQITAKHYAAPGNDRAPAQ